MTGALNSTPPPPFSPTAHQALRALAADSAPGVSVVCGFPAAGKTTATRLLAEMTGAVVLDKDTFAPRLEEAVMAELTGDPYDRDSDTYRRVVSPHLYAALVQHAVHLGARVPVIVDGPFLGYIDRAAAQGARLSDYIRTITGSTTAIRTIWISTDPTHIRDRMTQRGAERDRPKLTDWHTYRTTVLDSGLAHTGPTVVDHLIPN